MGCRNRTRWQIEGTECENSFRHYRIADLLSRVAVVLIALYPDTVFAHIGTSETLGFFSGLLHPVSGLDHILTMVAVGLWGAQLVAPAVWILPITFPLVMAFGGASGLIGLPLPGTDVCIALSAIALGLMVFRPFVRGGKVG